MYSNLMKILRNIKWTSNNILKIYTYFYVIGFSIEHCEWWVKMWQFDGFFYFNSHISFVELGIFNYFFLVGILSLCINDVKEKKK